LETTVPFKVQRLEIVLFEPLSNLTSRCHTNPTKLITSKRCKSYGAYHILVWTEELVGIQGTVEQLAYDFLFPGLALLSHNRYLNARRRSKPRISPEAASIQD